MTMVVATIMPNGFDFTVYIRNSSKYLVLGIYNFGSKVFLWKEKYQVMVSGKTTIL